MSEAYKGEAPNCYLLYEFWYEGIHHKGKVDLDESVTGVKMMYDDHDIEISWIKHIRHKGKYIEINIVINDDAYDPNEGKVTASAWVCVYNKYSGNIIDGFEPEYWAYIDEMYPSNNANKKLFYQSNT